MQVFTNWAVEEYKFGDPVTVVHRETLGSQLELAQAYQLIRTRFDTKFKQGANIDGVRLVRHDGSVYFKWDYYDLKNDKIAFQQANLERKSNQPC